MSNNNKRVYTFSELLDIAERESVSNAIECVNEQLPDYPQRPTKPTININKATSEEVIVFSEKLKKWEVDIVQYNEKLDEYRKIKLNVEDTIVKLISHLSGLNRIPEQYRQKVYSIAYEDGHSYGYHEVYSKLCTLVEIFE